MARILAVESSCDETAAAVVEDRCVVLSSVVASPLERAGAGLEGIDAVAVTRGPGLVGSLLVGLCAAKAISWQRNLPLIAVNHLEGHVRSPFIENPGIELPAVALVVSGGHTAVYHCPEEDIYVPLARTRDDAAGEAFDKVAKLFGLGYPGGPVIDRISRGADERAVEFPKAVMKDHSLDFSFSGLKTAVRVLAQREGISRTAATGGEATARVRDIVASFQRNVVETLVGTTLRACRLVGVRTVLVAGGVACNTRLRRAFGEAAAAQGLAVYVPSPRYTTDNAAMIGAAAFLHLERDRFARWDVSADASLKLGAPRPPEAGGRTSPRRRGSGSTRSGR